MPTSIQSTAAPIAILQAARDTENTNGTRVLPANSHNLNTATSIYFPDGNDACGDGRCAPCSSPAVSFTASPRKNLGIARSLSPSSVRAVYKPHPTSPDMLEISPSVLGEQTSQVTSTRETAQAQPDNPRRGNSLPILGGREARNHDLSLDSKPINGANIPTRRWSAPGGEAVGRIPGTAGVDSGGRSIGRNNLNDTSNFIGPDTLHTPSVIFATDARPDESHDDQRLRPSRKPSVRESVSKFFRVHLLKRSDSVVFTNTGMGTKATQMSQELPDDFEVPIQEDLLSLLSPTSVVSGVIKRRKCIGSGGSATVMERRMRSSSQLCAVKKFMPQGIHQSHTKYTMTIKSEFGIASSADHPNIVKSTFLCHDRDSWFMVMELCEGGDLFSLALTGCLSGNEHIDDRACLFRQLIRGLNYLHQNGIAHRDIKPENLLLTKDSALKITDFGLAEVFSGKHPAIRTTNSSSEQSSAAKVRLCKPGICGTTPYLPPEVMQEKDEYDPRLVDTWGAALIMLVMACKGIVWTEAIYQEGRRSNYNKLVDAFDGWHKERRAAGDEQPKLDEMNGLPKVPFIINLIKPVKLQRLLLKMLNPDPSERIQIEEVATDKWVLEQRCCVVTSPKETKYRHNHLPRKR